MEIEVKRLEHFGIVAGIIKDLDVVNTINELIGVDDQEDITHGEAIAGMVLNGLHFVSKPLMLTPQFFENVALEKLMRPGITAEHFNRHKLGRVLDRAAEYGTEKLFSQIALKACIQEKVDMKFAHADTTSYSLTGQYDSDSDTETIAIKHGHSKDMRPDLKQVVQELITSQDGGIPFATKAFDGNASDSIIFRERINNVVEEFKKSQSRCFVADSKLFSEKSAEALNKINFITRVPSSIKLEKKTIEVALKQNTLWIDISNGYKIQEFPIDLYEISDQRWIVVFSKQARDRSEKTLKKEVAKEKIIIEKLLNKLQAQNFSCEIDAKKALKAVSKKFKFHQISEEKTTEHQHYAHSGRPAANAKKESEWKIEAKTAANQEYFDNALNQRSCFVLVTNMTQNALPAKEVLTRYKGQDNTEKGFAFLKSPEFFTSSLFLKKPSRIDGLLMIMVLSLLIYSIAQRRLRMLLSSAKLTVLDQINKPTARPTMRWIFQLFEGISYVSVSVNGSTNHIIHGLNETRQKIITLFGGNIQKIYQAI